MLNYVGNFMYAPSVESCSGRPSARCRARPTQPSERFQIHLL